jgi:hypothetical protein
MKGDYKMITTATDLWRDRRELYKLSDKLREEYNKADEADRAAWEWYEALTEEEYIAIAREADFKVEESSKTCRRLREYLESVEATIKLMEKLESEIQYLENEKVI